MSNIKRTLKNQAKRAMFEIFERGQHFGLDILPRHFYSQVPDLRILRSRAEWKRPRDLQAVPGHDLAAQIRFAHSVCEPEVVRAAVRENVYARACERNGEPGYGPIEGIFLHAFIRKFRPARVVQVGCGVSTAIILAAARDAGYAPRITCIDPFPTDFLRDTAKRGEIELIEGPAQQFVTDPALALGNGDLFFVDSTHTVSPGSEVNVIILDVLPRLAQGVMVHFHDINFPYDYPRRLLDGELFCHAESTLLHAFLSCNDRYEMLAAMSVLHFAAPDELAKLIPEYRPGGNDEGLETSAGHFPSALYMQRT